MNTKSVVCSLVVSGLLALVGCASEVPDEESQEPAGNVESAITMSFGLCAVDSNGNLNGYCAKKSGICNSVDQACYVRTPNSACVVGTHVTDIVTTICSQCGLHGYSTNVSLHHTCS